MYHQAFIVLLVAIAASQAATATYENHKVLGIWPTSQETVKFLRQLGNDDNLLLDFWNEPRAPFKPVYVRVSPKVIAAFEKILHEKHIPFFVRHSNLQKILDENRKELLSKPRRAVRAVADFTEDEYHTLAEINQFLDAIVAESGGTATVETIGSTFEQRDIRVLKLLNPGKQIIFIEAGIHAREWISPATTLYFIKHLVTGDSDFASFKADYEWHFLVNTNPDGYAFSWTFNERLWRKNRQTYSGASCVGADVNRNADSNFGGEGSSDVVCSETYHGPSAFSELESQALRDYTLANSANLLAYISFHSYSQLWMFPYGYSTSRPADYTKLNALSKAATDAIFNYSGTRYDYGQISTTIYVASGGTIDWAYDSAGVHNIWTAELPDTGFYGFELPASRIVPVSLETWEGLKALIIGLK